MTADPRVQQARERAECPNCGSPWMEGTGLYLCGEGIRGFVHGGCHEHYTAQRIRDLADRVAALETALRPFATNAETLTSESARRTYGDGPVFSRADTGPDGKMRVWSVSIADVERAACALAGSGTEPAQERPAEPDEFAGWSTCPICNGISTEACATHGHLAKQEPPAEGSDR